MNGEPQDNRRQVVALRVHQWLAEWDRVHYDQREHRAKPGPCFYVFTLSAAELKALTGIHRRQSTDAVPRSEDLGVQRRHEESRSDEIRRYVRYGYPWSDLSRARRESGKYDDLRNPGWLPTAIVVDIKRPGTVRRGRELADEDAIIVTEGADGTASISLPEGFTDATWRPTGLHPLEVIDGQHRLWAFEDQTNPDQPHLLPLEDRMGGQFELPVIAFYGLDVSWRAYLFWTINISPKRINKSLAFDLYPLLRTETWLQRFDARVYRETRAQELTEALWSYPASPWHQRVNMLGEPSDTKTVSQAAWIRALMASYIKAWEGRGVRIGGLFGAPVGVDEEALPWSRAQQAAFLIYVWQSVATEVAANTADHWASELRAGGTARQDPAFAGAHTLLNTDQGIRGMLAVTNDLLYIRADELGLDEWGMDLMQGASATDHEAIAAALEDLTGQGAITAYIGKICRILATYDWRTSTAPGLTDNERAAKLAFRGSSGYRELRRQLLGHLVRAKGEVGAAADEVMRELGYC